MLRPSFQRPPRPLSNPFHPSARGLVQGLVACTQPFFTWRDLNFNGGLLAVTNGGDYSQVTDPATGSQVLQLNGANTDSCTLPYSNRAKAMGSIQYTFLIRVQFRSIPSTSDALAVAENDGGGDGCFLHNASATAVYSFIFGNQTPNLTVNVNNGIWENIIGRWVSGGVVELWSFSDAGVKDTTRGGTNAAGTTGTMNFASTSQTLFKNSANAQNYLFDYYLAWNRYVSDGEISGLIRENKVVTARRPPIWAGPIHKRLPIAPPAALSGPVGLQGIAAGEW